MAAKQPSPEVLRRHKAAMTLVNDLPEPDRVLLLWFVVAGSERIRELEAAEDSEDNLERSHRGDVEASPLEPVLARA